MSLGKDKQVSFDHLVRGKIPPQDMDLEEKVIGAIMIQQSILDDVADILSPDMFYKEAHRIIYEAITTLSAESKPIDITTVMIELKRMGKLEAVGGPFHLTAITDSIVGYGNEEFYARKLAELHVKRQTIISASEAIKACYDDTTDAFEVLSGFADSKDSLLNQITSRKEVTTDQIFDMVMEDLEKVDVGMTGVPSGIQGIDAVFGGFQNSDLIIVGARPSVGKTSFVLSMVSNAARKYKKKIAFFSLEMNNLQLGRKFMSIAAGIDLYKFRDKKYMTDVDKKRLREHKAMMQDAEVYWDDTPGLSLVEFRAKARRLKRKGLEMIVIDYLQLMTLGPSFKGSREQEISKISRGLKIVAKELDIPIIALAQLSRALESRPGNRKLPQLSDLRESGSLEQDADVVMFIYRPEMHGITEDEEGVSTAGVAEISIAKHRNGELGLVKLQFIGKYTKFMDTEDSLMSASRASEGMQASAEFNDMPKFNPNRFTDNDDPF